MSWFDKLFPVKKDIEALAGNKTKLKKAISETSTDIKKGLVAGDPKTWHHIIMGGVFAATGLMIIGVMFVNFLLVHQERQMKARPIVTDSINSKLTEGDYTIFGIIHPAAFAGKTASEDNRYNVNAFLVSDRQGGVLVAVAPPDGTAIPNDMYGIDCYTLSVDADGNWQFHETARLQQLREHMKGAGASEPFPAGRPHVEPTNPE